MGQVAECVSVWVLVCGLSFLFLLLLLLFFLSTKYEQRARALTCECGLVSLGFLVVVIVPIGNSC